MARVLAVAMIAVAAVALYAATAPAGQQAVTPKQLAALQKRVKSLEGGQLLLLQAVALIVHCGFDKTAVPTTKSPQFHATATGETTDFYVLATTDTECVDFINAPLVRQLLKQAR
jgi:hypothetical protein